MQDFPFEPLYDKIVVIQDDPEEVTATGLIIPKVAQERHAQGEVVAIGPGYRMEDGSLQPLTVEVGQRILFGKYGGTTIEIGGVTFVIMSEREVHGILHNASAEGEPNATDLGPAHGKINPTGNIG